MNDKNYSSEIPVTMGSEDRLGLAPYASKLTDKPVHVEAEADIIDKLKKQIEVCIQELMEKGKKRIINSFVLLDMVNLSQNNVSDHNASPEKSLSSTKLLLALTCLQTRLEPDYRFQYSTEQI